VVDSYLELDSITNKDFNLTPMKDHPLNTLSRFLVSEIVIFFLVVDFVHNYEFR